MTCFSKEGPWHMWAVCEWQPKNNWHEYNLDEFKSHFVQICGSHRAEGRALAFAFILYDLRHPEILKVLDDPRYYESLNRISGRYLSVFFMHHPLHVQQGESGPELRTECDPASEALSILKKYFDVTWDISRPAILFFQLASGTLMDAFVVTINAKGTEEAHRQISQTMGLATESISHVEPQNVGNDRQIYLLMKDCLMSEAFKSRLKTVFAKVRIIRKII